MTNPKDIVDNILTMLKADADLAALKNHWHKGEPKPGTWNKFPFGWVEWSGGPGKPRSVTINEFTEQVHIVVVCMHVDHKRAEDSAMEYAALIKDVLSADYTLLGAVARSWCSARVKDKFFTSTNHNLTVVRVTWTVTYLE